MTILLAVVIGLMVFLGFEAHCWLERRRQAGKPVSQSMKEQIERILPHEKTAFFGSPTIEDYEEWQKETTERGGLLKAINAKMPWSSPPPKSPSSDS